MKVAKRVATRNVVPEFARVTIDVISRRAALICSNPDCCKLTVGPNSDQTKVTTIGQGAHIYGARLGAARYRSAMSDVERASISNALWLCSDCHITIDRDANQYTPELLFVWKKTHESEIVKKFGKRSEIIKGKIHLEEMAKYGMLTPYMKQIISDKPDLWEYILTVEALEFYLAPVLREKYELEKNLYSRPILIMDPKEYIRWVKVKINEISRPVENIVALLKEIQLAWGAPGVSGNCDDILRACELYADCGRRLVDVAEDLSFTSAPEGFEGLNQVLVEGALYPVSNLSMLAKFIRDNILVENPSGVHHFTLVIDLPEGWSEKVRSKLDQGQESLASRGYVW